MQAGPITSVFMPKDKVTGTHQNYGFVEFRSEEVGGGRVCVCVWGGGGTPGRARAGRRLRDEGHEHG